jgi:uncharacterized protein
VVGAKRKPYRNFSIVADWGNANFHMIAGWICAHLRWRSAPLSQFRIHTGTGYIDNIEKVATGEVDVGITTPFDVSLEWARTGKHAYGGRAYPYLRALGWLPQFDKLVFAVRADTGVTSFADIRERKFPLKIATGFRVPTNLMTWTVNRVFRHHGIEPENIEKWGGAWLEHDHPRICIPAVTRGEADAVINEAIVVPQWRDLLAKVPMRFIPFEKTALDTLRDDFGLRPSILPKSHFGLPEDVPCLDWSNWAVFAREDMPEDEAYEIVSIMVEERAELEGRFRHLPPERAPMTYPIDPHKMWQGLGAPLHPGAERYYREHGYMK